MKNTTKTATQKALEFKRQELKDIKATAKRAQSQLKKDVATLRYEMKTLRANVKSDKADDRQYRKQAVIDRKAARKAVRDDIIAARLQKRGERVLKASERLNARSEKAAARAAKKAARIDAIQAKLDSLKNPVGIHAKKAAKKPSKAIVIVNPLAALSAAMNKKAA
jgi:hypothetical protein